MSEINAEFALGNSLSNYQGVTWWTDSNTTGTFPASGAISMGLFYNKRKTQPMSQQSYDFTWSSSGTFIVPSNYVSLVSLNVYVVGGGGQGAGWPSGAEGAGGAEGAWLNVTSYALAPSQQYTVTVGSGGTSAQTNGQSGNAGGNSVFGSGTGLAITARGGVGGIASGGATSRNLTANVDYVTTALSRRYYLGGASSGRSGPANSSTYGGGGGASNCYDADGNGAYDDGGTSALNAFFSGTNVGKGGSGCGGGDHRISNKGFWPGGGGGGADYNATGGNGADGAIRVVLTYMGTL